MDVFGTGDIGWAGAFTPMIVSASTLGELRNLAGMPTYPGQKMFMVDLVTGQAKWYARGRSSGGYRRRSGSRRRRR